MYAKAPNMAEAYWMSLTRDVPFSEYGDDETTIAASGTLDIAFCLIVLYI